MRPRDLKKRFMPVFRKYGVRKAILFGSAGRGEMTLHSDIDLILVMDTKKRFLERYEGILYELNNILKGTYVEPLIYTPQELNAMKKRPFIAQALKEGISLYECKRVS
jgi:predicted nucleotidyltransferase